VKHPMKAFWVSLRGPRTTGPMAPEVGVDGNGSGNGKHNGHGTPLADRPPAAPAARALPVLERRADHSGVS
jgi:hypothetical protein